MDFIIFLLDDECDKSETGLTDKPKTTTTTLIVTTGDPDEAAANSLPQTPKVKR